MPSTLEPIRVIYYTHTHAHTHLPHAIQNAYNRMSVAGASASHAPDFAPSSMRLICQQSLLPVMRINEPCATTNHTVTRAHASKYLTNLNAPRPNARCSHALRFDPAIAFRDANAKPKRACVGSGTNRLTFELIIMCCNAPAEATGR